tara:strand:+ start:5423 stop:5560 length:138 start_codon:yes stop_codon:yes gene_type:complete
MTDHHRRQVELLQSKNNRSIDVVVAVVCIFGGFAVGIYSALWGWL